MKKIIDNLLNNRFFEIPLVVLIVLNLIMFIIQTDSNINAHFQKQFYYFEVFSVSIFSIEYILRIIVIKNYKEIFKPIMIVDLMAILPFYLSFITFNATFLRVFRLFKLFKIAKIIRYTNAFNNIKNAFIKRQYEISVAIFILIVAILISAISIYFAEHHTNNEAFKSIISSFWWSIITITTVGYGDSIPITLMGKLIASLTAIFGVGLHGVMIGVISTALMEVIKENEKE